MFEDISNKVFAVPTLKVLLIAGIIFVATPHAHALVLSGTLYSDEGVTVITSSKTISIAVGTTTTSLHATTTSGAADGTWTFDLGGGHSIVASTPIVIWVDGDTSTRATLFTKASSTNDIANLNLYQDRVIISHEGTSGTSTTLSNLSFYDFDNDNDIQYAATSSGTTTGSLTVFTGNELHINTGKTFTASGTVTINANATASSTDGSFHIADGATYIGGGTLTIGGSFTASTTATFTHNGYSTMMNATTTGKTINVPLTTIGALSLSGSNGGWTMATTSTTTSLSIGQGTFVAPSTTLAVSSLVNSGTFTHNAGTLNVTGHADATTQGIATYLAGRDVSGSSGGTGSVQVNALVISGNFLYVGKSGDATACSQTIGSADGCELMVFDISSTTNPIYVAGRDASGSNGGTGSVQVNALVISGNFLYVGKSGDATACSQTAGSAIGCELMVFDISSSTNPIYVAGRDASGNSAGTGNVQIRSLSTYGSYLYLGKAGDATACSQTAGSADGCELQVYSISSTTNPVYVVGRDASGSSTGVDADAHVTSVLVSGSYMYVGVVGGLSACSQTVGSAQGCELQVYDVSSSTNPLYTAGRDRLGDASGNSAMGSFTPVMLARQGNFLFVVQNGDVSGTCSQTAGSAGNCMLLVFDISSSTNPVYVAGRSSGGNTSAAYGTPYAMTISGNYLYVGKDDYDGGTCSFTRGDTCTIMVFDISSTTNPVFVGRRDGTAGTSGAWGAHIYALALSGGTLFVGKAGDATACSQVAGSAIGCELMVFDKTQLPKGAIAGTLVGNSALNTINTAGLITFNSPATTTTFTINSATTTAPAYLTIQGNYTNNSILKHNSGTIYFSSTSAQTISGATTGSSAFYTASFLGSGTKTFSNNASTTNLIVNSGAIVIAPTSFTTETITNEGTLTSGSLVTVSDSFTNTGTFTAPSNTFNLAGGAYNNSGTFNNNSATTNIGAYIGNYLAGRDASGSSGGTGNVAISRLVVSDDYLYVGKITDFTACSQTAGSADGCELMVFDISSTTNPIYVKGFDSDGSTSGTLGPSINSLTISGSTLYVGKESDGTACSQTAGSAQGCELMVFDISSTTNPRYVKGFDSDGSTNGTLGPAIYSLTISSSTLYVGKNSDVTACSQTAGSAQGCELMVFDISSTTNPFYVKGYDSDGSTNGTLGLAINSLITVGSTLYVGKYPDATACSQVAGSAIGCELMVFDISSTTNPIYVAGRDETGNSTGTGSNYITTLTTSGSTLYIIKPTTYDPSPCSQIAGSAISCEIMVFDISSSTNPIYVAGRDISGSADGTLSASPYSFTTSGSVLYIGKESINTTCSQTAGSAIGCELMVFDISSTTNPVFVKGYDSDGSTNGTLGPPIYSFAISGNSLYVGKGSDTTACSQTAGSAQGCELMVFGLQPKLSGTMTGSSAFNDLTISGAGAIFSTTSSASTSDLTINSGATVVAPGQLSISGDYTNSGTFTAGTGTTTFNGTSLQTATGTMSATSSFYNLEVTNNTATTTFGSTLTASSTFTAIRPNTILAFPHNATTTFANAIIAGTSGNSIKLRSSSSSAQFNIVVSNAYTISYVSVKDSNACASVGGSIVPTYSSEDGNTTCWSLSGGLLLSGTLYSDEGVTPITALVPVAIAIGTTTTSVHATTSLASGSWSFNVPGDQLIGTSTPILIWTDATSSIRASLFTKASTSAYDIPNLNLYQDRVIISHEGTSGTSTTLSNLAFYDFDNDNDIQYAATSSGTTTGSLTVFTGNELHINTGKTFTASGTVTINANATASSTDGSFHIADGATYIGGGTLTIGGSFTASTTATFTHNGYSTMMNATTTGKTINVPLTTIGALSLSGSNGGWTMATTSTTTNLSIGQGTFVAPSTTLAVQSLMNQGVLTSNGGTLTVSGAAEGVEAYLAGRDASGDSGGTGDEGINDMVLSGNYLYLGLSGDATACSQTAGSAIGCELKVFDISSSTNPIYVAGRDVSGSAAGAGNVGIISLIISGNYLYVGKFGDVTACSQTAGSAIGCELMVFDISSSTNPIYVAGRDVSGDSTGVGSEAVYYMAISGNFLYVPKTGDSTVCSQTAGSAIGCELMVFDISSSTNPVYVAGRDSRGNSTGAGGVSYLSLIVHGTYLYAGKGGNGSLPCSQTAGDSGVSTCELMVFDISSSTNPIYVAGRDASGDSTGVGSVAINSLAVSGNSLYVGKSGNATACSQTAGSAIGCELMVFDISSTTNPIYVKGFDDSGSLTGNISTGIWDLVIFGNYLYIGKAFNTSGSPCLPIIGRVAGSCDLMIFDVSSTTNPVLLNGVDAVGSRTAFANHPDIGAIIISGNYLYAGKYNNATACSQTAGSAWGCELMVFDRTKLFPQGTLVGTLVGSSALNQVQLSNSTLFVEAASTTNLTINTNSTTSASSTLTIMGSYSNNGVFMATTSYAVYVSSSSAQTLTGTMTGSSAFKKLTFLGSGTKTFSNNASTTDLTIDSSSGAVTAPTSLTVNGTLTNASTLTLGSGTTTLQGSYVNSGTFTHNGGMVDIKAYISDYLAGRDGSGNSTNGFSAPINSLTISGNYLYVAKDAESTACSQTAGAARGCELMVFDISSTTNPIYVAGRDAAGDSASTSAIDINSLAISGNYLYVGKGSTNTACSQTAGYARGCELMVFDISSSTNPIYVAGRDASGDSTGVGSVTINSLAVSGNSLYVGKSGDATACSQTAGSAIGCELMVFDISSTTNPIYVAGRDATGDSTGVGSVNSASLVISGNYLYVGKAGNATACSQTTGSAEGCELMVFDISSTTNPVYVAGRDSSGSSAGTGGSVSVSSLAISGNYLYVGKTSDFSSSPCSQTAGSAEPCELIVFDISSTTNPTYVAGRDVSGDSTGVGNQAIYALAVSGNSLLVGKGGNVTACSQAAGSAFGCELIIFDISSTTNPVYVAERESSGNSYGSGGVSISSFMVSGNYLYVANQGSAINCSQTAGSAQGCELQVYLLPSRITGNATGSSALGDITISGAGAIFSTTGSASTSDLMINSGATVVAPAALSISGHYTNNGTFTNNGGTVVMSSTSATSTYANFSFDTAGSGNTLPYAMTYANGYFWITDNTDDEVYKYNATGTYTGTSFDTNASGNADPDGITYANGFFWITDDVDAKVYKYTATGTYTGMSFDTAGSGNSVPTGITYADGFFWIVDITDVEVYKYTATGTYTGTSFDTAGSGNGAVWSITYANGYLWLNDYTDLKVYQYTATGTYTGVTFNVIGDSALTYANGYFWISDDATDEVYKYSYAQTLQGNMTGSSTFNNLSFVGQTPKAFAVASTTNLTGNASATSITIDASSGEVSAPPVLTLTGNYSNATTSGFAHNWGTVIFSSTSAQTISGTLTGSSAFATTTFQLSGTKTLSNNASTSHFTIGSGATVVAPSALTISGNYTNSGTFTAGSGTTTFNGIAQQIATGTLSGTSAFNNLRIDTATGTGSTTQGVIFGAPLETLGTYSMSASTSALFLANATATLQNIRLMGTTTRRVYLRSSITDTDWGLSVAGTQEVVTGVNVKDSNACSGNPDIDASDGSSYDAGNNTCWDLGYIKITASSSQSFAIGDATTTMSTTTITDGITPIITAANDIRIKIATSSVRMKFDTTATTLTFGGSASGKVANPVSYEGDGSVLVIPVSSDFSTRDTLMITGLSFAQFTAVNNAQSAIGVYTGGAADTISDDDDDKTITIRGAITLENHTAGQLTDALDFPSQTNTEIFAFRLTPLGEAATITALTIRLQGVNGIYTSDITNAKLIRDVNDDRTYDDGDTEVGGGGSVSINAQNGTITFSTAFSATTTHDYFLIIDIAELSGANSMYVGLSSSGITALGTTTGLSLTTTGTLDFVEHRRGSMGAGGSSAAIGGAPPAGDGIRGGGGEGGGGEIDPNTGDTIGSEAGFNAPSAHGTPHSGWTGGTNAYASDGAYTTTAGTGAQHSYGNFGFSVPSNDEITGFAVKIEGSASTEAGTISVRLSWDGGGSVTSLGTTNTLGTTDAVFELGGQGDTWGRTWTPSETNNGNFTIEVVSNPSSNTVRIDAIQVKVFHQATGGGGGGGGGAVFKDPGRYFANVYRGAGETIIRFLRKIQSFFEW